MNSFPFFLSDIVAWLTIVSIHLLEVVIEFSGLFLEVATHLNRLTIHGSRRLMHRYVSAGSATSAAVGDWELVHRPSC